MEQASKRDEGSCVLDRRGGMKRKGKKACRQGGEGRRRGGMMVVGAGCIHSLVHS